MAKHDNQMRILLAIEDITETKVNEQDKANLIDRLAGEQERLNVILNNMPAGIIIVDDKEQIVFSNSTARQILGDQDFTSMFGISETLNGVRVQDKEVIITVDNQTRYLSVNTVRIFDTETETKLAVVNFIDISRRKKEEEQLKSAQENLNVALEAARMGVWDLNIDNRSFSSQSSV